MIDIEKKEKRRIEGKVSGWMIESKRKRRSGKDSVILGKEE